MPNYDYEPEDIFDDEREFERFSPDDFDDVDIVLYDDDDDFTGDDEIYDDFIDPYDGADYDEGY